MDEQLREIAQRLDEIEKRLRQVKDRLEGLEKWAAVTEAVHQVVAIHADRR
jgi:tetrahydromethanopterin S-methyltransferase subunit G